MAVWSTLFVLSLTIRDYCLSVLPVKVALGLYMLPVKMALGSWTLIVLALCVGSDLGDICSRLPKVGAR